MLIPVSWHEIIHNRNFWTVQGGQLRNNMPSRKSIGYSEPLKVGGYRDRYVVHLPAHISAFQEISLPKQILNDILTMTPAQKAILGAIKAINGRAIFDNLNIMIGTLDTLAIDVIGIGEICQTIHRKNLANWMKSLCPLLTDSSLLSPISSLNCCI